MSTPLIGDVVVVATGNSWGARLIRVGQALRGQACTGNHVAIMHHYTDRVPWGVEGRPGGVGWVDMRRFLSDKRTVSNAAQPKTDEQRTIITTACQALLGTPYDWSAIFSDSLASLGVKALWDKDWDGQGAPGQVVCSSAAALVYAQAGLARPKVGHERYVFPSDWSEFCYEQAWDKPIRPA